MTPFSSETLRFAKGQWLDVQDPEGEWLEGRALDVLEHKVLVHYHGFSSLWDEWLPLGSTRLAVFRSHTVQPLDSAFLSPMPVSETSPLREDRDEVLNQVRDTVQKIGGMIELLNGWVEKGEEIREVHNIHAQMGSP
jgi:hypothetical protein